MAIGTSLSIVAIYKFGCVNASSAFFLGSANEEKALGGVNSIDGIITEGSNE